jgi:hypothetical protein
MAAKATTKVSVGKTAQWEKTLESYFVGKAPALPQGIKDFLVKYGPYLVIVSVLFGIQGLLALYRLNSAVSSLYYAVGYTMGTQYYLGLAFSAVALVLEGLAIKGLLARTKQGWNMLFYATLVNGVYMLVSMNLVGLVLGMLISLYVLFQIKSAYK